MDQTRQLKTGPAGIALIEKYEGCRLVAYQDVAGIWTIGYGHANAHADQFESQGDAEAALCCDLATAEAAVNRLVTVPLNQNQFDALVSFTYNEGGGRLAGSKILKFINNGLYASAASQLRYWDFVGGNVSRGLAARRAAETELFLKAE